MTGEMTPLELAWLPIATSTDVPFRHVFHGQLLGQELAVWRADDGVVNVWENRCPHRGVRLSIGHNLGHELKCQYHGWRYESGSGRCTSIPAHPSMTPPRVVCSKSYRSTERYGVIWSTLQAKDDLPQIDDLEGKDALVLRSMPMRASAQNVAAALMGYRFVPAANVTRQEDKIASSVRESAMFRLRAEAKSVLSVAQVLLFVQPASIDLTIVHGILLDSMAPEQEFAVLRHHNGCLSDIRAIVEKATAKAEANTGSRSPALTSRDQSLAS